jgi:hypothetical protein
MEGPSRDVSFALERNDARWRNPSRQQPLGPIVDSDQRRDDHDLSLGGGPGRRMHFPSGKPASAEVVVEGDDLDAMVGRENRQRLRHVVGAVDRDPRDASCRKFAQATSAAAKDLQVEPPHAVQKKRRLRGPCRGLAERAADARELRHFDADLCRQHSHQQHPEAERGTRTSNRRH